ncbi:MAG: iron-sulfur cluster repair di-iron protein [Phycisphaerales bacterium]|nr:iron-sulfur cluster repair di-iron protein [Phycisphaerales bacterium]
MTINAQATIGQMVTERPSRARVFERVGIDYCCGGGKTLEAACAAKGLQTGSVLAELEASDAARGSEAVTDWEAQGAGALADHVERTHHEYLKRELPRLTALTAKVAAVHGPSDATLVELRDVYATFAAEMMEHMMKEEKILFPWIRALASGQAPAAHSPICSGIKNPVRMMMAEHEDSGAALEKMRELTRGFKPPPQACNTYRAMLDGLAELESDTHTHVHKENSILFPMAVKLEEALGAR